MINFFAEEVAKLPQNLKDEIFENVKYKIRRWEDRRQMCTSINRRACPNKQQQQQQREQAIDPSFIKSELDGLQETRPTGNQRKRKMSRNSIEKKSSITSGSSTHSGCSLPTGSPSNFNQFQTHGLGSLGQSVSVITDTSSYLDLIDA